jgi:predicted acetyltransferase
LARTTAGLSMPRLALPDTRYRLSFLAAMDEFAAEGRVGDDTMVGRDLEVHGPTWATSKGFAAYVDEVLAEVDRPRQPGFVCSTTWWWVEGEEYVGRIAVRHDLTPHLLEVGGHVGYDVRRSRRGEGHATRMLAVALPEVRALGIDPALVTCSHDNAASRRVIEANGGILEDQRGERLRFWIPTTRVGR